MAPNEPTRGDRQRTDEDRNAVYDAEARYVRVSHAMAALNGVPVGQHLGRRPTEVLPAGAGALVEARVRRVLAGMDSEAGAADEGAAAWRGGRRSAGRRGAGRDALVAPRPGPSEPLEPPEPPERPCGDGSTTHWLPVRGDDGAVVGVAQLVTDAPDAHPVDASARTAILQRMTSALAGAASVAEVRGIVAVLGHLLAASRAELRLLDDDTARAPWRVGRVGLPGQRGRAGAALDGWPAPLAAAVRTGTPRYLADTAAFARMRAEPEGTSPPPGEGAWAALPLVGARGPLGGICLTFDRPRHFDGEERAFLATLAGQFALAVGRAKAHDREHGQVAVLQRALLPDRLPDLPGGRFAFRYLSGTPDVAVGGDWYDAFAFPDGRFGLVVGDVIGKGIGAAAGMARVRTAVRALAYSDPRPRGVLTGLDRLFDATESDESLTTLVYAVLDPPRRHLVFADAGHLPLLLVARDGTARYAEGMGGPDDPDGDEPAATPLGYAEQRADRGLDLAPGEIVVAFSDGLVENRRRALGDGLDELLVVASGPNEGVGELLDRILRRMFERHERDDDVTLLAAALD